MLFTCFNIAKVIPTLLYTHHILIPNQLKRLKDKDHGVPRTMLRLANEIVCIEEEVEDIEIEMFNEIIQLCDKATASLCTLSKEL